jgi:hypothetical protein
LRKIHRDLGSRADRKEKRNYQEKKMGKLTIRSPVRRACDYRFIFQFSHSGISDAREEYEIIFAASIPKDF